MTHHPVSQPLLSSEQVHRSSSTPNLKPRLQSAIHTLKLGEFQARWDAAKRLSEYGLEAIPYLLDLLQLELQEDVDWEVLWFVARILGKLEHPQAIEALVQILFHANHSEVAGMAATALAQQGTAAIEPLSQLLEQESARLLAVQALTQIRHPDVVAPLSQTVDDPDPHIRAAAIEALSHFYEPAISTILLTALSDIHPIVRKASITGLGMQAEQLHKSELVEHLKPYLRDFNLEVCCQTAMTLGRVATDTAIEALSEILHSPHTPFPLQTEVVRALSWIGTPYAIEQLQTCLHTMNNEEPAETSLALRHEIFSTLGRIEATPSKPKAAEVLLEQLKSVPSPTQDLRSKQMIALSLGQLGQLEAIDPLIQLLADPNVSIRLHTIAALKQLNADIARDRLQQFSEQPHLDGSLRQGVEVALREWE